MSPQIYSGEGGRRKRRRAGTDLLPPLAPSPLAHSPLSTTSLLLPFYLFFYLYYYVPLHLSSAPLLPPTSLTPSSSHSSVSPPLGRHSSYFVPPVPAGPRSLGRPDSVRRGRQPIHLPASGLPKGAAGEGGGEEGEGSGKKREEQRSSFITMAINNANSAAVAAGERKRLRGPGLGGGCRRWGPTGARQ